MQRLLALTWLTVKAAFRFRLVLMLAIILLGSVVLLPLIIKDDQTARGFTQILITYTLSLITALLGFATLWLACGTLARDVEECQIQMVVVKPVARWQIWLGKWLGILVVNAILLLLSAGAVFFLLQWRAQRLPPDQQRILRNEILVSRGSAKPAVPNYDAEVDAAFKERLKNRPIAESDVKQARTQILEQLKALNQITPPGFQRSWVVNLGLARNSLRGKPLSLRMKFNAAQPSPNQTYRGFWMAGDPDTGRLHRSEEMSLAADTFHEFPVPPDLFDDTGKLAVHFVNTGESVLLFPEEEGIEVLYPEGGFALNYLRGLGIIFFWLSFLAAIGLMASSFLSFPVAAFFSLGVLIVGMSTGTISLILEQGTVFEVNHDTGVADKQTPLDHVALPVFRALLNLINLVRGFSPIDSLSTGRSVSWGQLGLAFVQICVLLCGIVAAIGITAFTRRELATAQSNQ
jgi:ABC-type transport system involved in multi-copper enzyme maturation permease subunit